MDPPPVSPPPPDRPRLTPALGVVAALVLLAVVVMLAPREPALRAAPTSPTDEMPELSETEAAITWTAIDGPDDVVRIETLLATPHGFVVISGPRADGATLWSTTDGSQWTPSPVTSSPYGVVTDADQLVVFREDAGLRLEFDDQRWIEGRTIELPTYVRTAATSGRPGLVYTDDGVFAHSLEGELYFAGDGEHFELAVGPGVWTKPDVDPWARFTAPLAPTGCRPPAAGSPDYPPLVETESGYVALLPANKAGPSRVWPVCDPELWESDDGLTWRPTGTTPFAPHSFVYDVAARRGSILAVGGTDEATPGAWLSIDGAAWESVGDRLPGSKGYVLIDVAAGDLGLVVLGDALDGRMRRAWFSTDGLCWERIPDAVAGQSVAVGTRAIMIASRDPSTGLWMGEPIPGGSAGCGA